MNFIAFLLGLFVAYPGPARQPALGIMGEWSPASGQTQDYAIKSGRRGYTGGRPLRPP